MDTPPESPSLSPLISRLTLSTKRKESPRRQESTVELLPLQLVLKDGLIGKALLGSHSNPDQRTKKSVQSKKMQFYSLVVPNCTLLVFNGMGLNGTPMEPSSIHLLVRSSIDQQAKSDPVRLSIRRTKTACYLGPKRIASCKPDDTLTIDHIYATDECHVGFIYNQYL